MCIITSINLIQSNTTSKIDRKASSHIHQLIDAVNFHLQFPSTIKSFIVYFVAFISFPLISKHYPSKPHKHISIRRKKKLKRGTEKLYNPPNKAETIFVSFLLMESVESALTNICQKSYFNSEYCVQTSLFLRFQVSIAL